MWLLLVPVGGTRNHRDHRQVPQNKGIRDSVDIYGNTIYKSRHVVEYVVRRNGNFEATNDRRVSAPGGLGKIRLTSLRRMSVSPLRVLLFLALLLMSQLKDKLMGLAAQAAPKPAFVDLRAYLAFSKMCMVMDASSKPRVPPPFSVRPRRAPSTWRFPASPLS